MPWEYVRPTTQADRDRIERKLYPDNKDKVREEVTEGVEIDINEENLRDNETSRGWAIRQKNKLSR